MRTVPAAHKPARVYACCMRKVSIKYPAAACVQQIQAMRACAGSSCLHSDAHAPSASSYPQCDALALDISHAQPWHLAAACSPGPAHRRRGKISSAFTSSLATVAGKSPVACRHSSCKHCARSLPRIFGLPCSTASRHSQVLPELCTLRSSCTCDAVLLSLPAGWMHILIGLLIASFFSRTAMIINICIWLTVLLPPKPILWNAFCRFDLAQGRAARQGTLWQHRTEQHSRPHCSSTGQC